MRQYSRHFSAFIGQLLLICLVLQFSTTNATRRHVNFVIDYVNVSRLCHNKSLIAVNGKFPGPTVRVTEGDHIIFNVTNLVEHNVTIHWHGVLQVLTNWVDGPEYITQCPIQPGRSFVSEFQIVEQRGTLFWHAHIQWLRATVHGAIVIQPRHKPSYIPSIKPSHEHIIILGEWWNADVGDVLQDALDIGRGYAIPDALTINGYPGALYNCSQHLTQRFRVTKGETYMLRLVNAALNFPLYFAIANHTLTVVEADAEYTQPLETDVVMLAPGQTNDILITANQPEGNYYMACSVFNPNSNIANVPHPNISATAVLTYSSSLASNISFSQLQLPSLPAFDDILYVANFTQSLRGYYAMNIPQEVHYDLLYTLSYSFLPCPTCQLPPYPGQRITTSINNETFVLPEISLLEAYYNHINGVYETDFPEKPPYEFNYTGIEASDIPTSNLGTKVTVLEFGKTVQIVFQNTHSLGYDLHPIHLHGQNFFLIGEGFGNYNASLHASSFNLRDPPFRNTVAVPSGGWAAIRFTTHNPGVWFMHCHFDLHSTWGMNTAFIVKNGQGKNETLPPPPANMPPC
ncbi:hypothetical protein GOP47_0010424 [Adiantum capillus-veneris]|uniref:Laccase n=1 Tax=Adiantum capillus-veneris TaxID=13818 RepID=A0A9D4UVU8_ADICA|nr:hypothetical protein GOP47_0010424 [Adiantum capillus-veneris]